jgi:hypothetical protein
MAFISYLYISTLPGYTLEKDDQGVTLSDVPLRRKNATNGTDGEREQRCP